MSLHSPFQELLQDGFMTELNSKIQAGLVPSASIPARMALETVTREANASNEHSQKFLSVEIDLFAPFADANGAEAPDRYLSAWAFF